MARAKVYSRALGTENDSSEGQNVSLDGLCVPSSLGSGVVPQWPRPLSVASRHILLRFSPFGLTRSVGQSFFFAARLTDVKYRLRMVSA